MVQTLTIAQARDAHRQNLAANLEPPKRLVYPGAGDDVGCSVHLFWHVCNEFYLIDPMYDEESTVDLLVKGMRNGTQGYTDGTKFTVGDKEKTVCCGIAAWKLEVSLLAVTRTVYLVRCGTSAWLTASETAIPSYSVVVDKDYEGITGTVDEEFPYAVLWSRLRRNGLYAETIGKARSVEGSGYATIRRSGFNPLHKVSAGFTGFLVIFQRLTTYDEPEFKLLASEIDGMRRSLTDVLLEATGGVDALEEVNPSDALPLRQAKAILAVYLKTKIGSHWVAVEQDPAFRQCVMEILALFHEPARRWWVLNMANVATLITQANDMITDLLAPLNLPSWGSVY